MVNLVPSQETVMQILEKTNAYRKGHFIYPNGKHASHYFQMPLAFRYYDNARILSVGLSRLFRMEKAISSRLPKISVISPSPGGIMVAFGVREALGAEQIYWAEMEEGTRQFRQYIGSGDVHPAIIVDDILRSGRAISETIKLVNDLGAGVTVAMVALPLAMAFGIASGVRPEQGIATAIVAGFLISVLGGSRVQIGGPAGAFVALLYSIAEKYGVAWRSS